MRLTRFDVLRRLRLGRRWTFVLGLFFVVKLTVVVSGCLALTAFGPSRAIGQETEQLHSIEADQRAISNYRSVSMWYAWDSFVYWKLSKLDYLAPAYVEGPPPADLWSSTPADPARIRESGRFSFYPAYPLTSWLVAKMLGDRYDVAPLVVSNLALLFVLYFGHRLGEAFFSSERAARRFAKFLLLAPGAIVLHGALSESLFLAFVLGAFFFAETRRWLMAGVLGAGAALTRSIGILICVPLALLAIEQAAADRAAGREWVRPWIRAIVSLAPIAIAWAGFLLYCKRMTGDALAYNTIQSRVLRMQLRNPFTVLSDALGLDPWMWDGLRAWIVVFCLGVVLLAARKLRLSYLSYALLFTLLPVTAGEPGSGLNASGIRYLAVVFPVALAITYFTSRRTIESHATLALAIFQGAILVVWVNYWTSFIV